MRSITVLSVLCLTQLFAQAPNYSISTIAGTDPTGDGGRARDARLYNPADIAVDAQGVIYFADTSNYRIRRIARDGTITTIAGGGEATEATDGMPATSILLLRPYGVALNPAANVLYFSDTDANTVYSVNLATGALATVAGSGPRSPIGSAGDGGSAKRALLAAPQGIAYDSTLGLLIADTLNNRVRRIDLTTGVISAFAGTGTVGFSGDGAAAIAAQFFIPTRSLLKITPRQGGRVFRVREARSNQLTA